MPNDLGELLQKRGLPVILNCLNGMVGKSVDVVVREEQFRKNLIDPAWAQLSVPMKLVGRERLRWEEFFAVVRKEAFELSKGKLVLRKDAADYFNGLIERLFPGEVPAAAPSEHPAEEEIAEARLLAQEPPPSESAEDSDTPDVELVDLPAPPPLTPVLGIDLGTTY